MKLKKGFSHDFCPQLLAQVPADGWTTRLSTYSETLQSSFGFMSQSLHPFLYEGCELVILSTAVHVYQSCRSKAWLIRRENEHVQRTRSQAWSPDRISSHSQSFRRTEAGTGYKNQSLLCIGLITDVFSELRTTKSSALLTKGVSASQHHLA